MLKTATAQLYPCTINLLPWLLIFLIHFLYFSVYMANAKNNEIKREKSYIFKQPRMKETNVSSATSYAYLKTQ